MPIQVVEIWKLLLTNLRKSFGDNFRNSHREIIRAFCFIHLSPHCSDVLYIYPYACCCIKKLQFSLLLFIWTRQLTVCFVNCVSSKQWKVKQTQFKAKVIAKLIHLDWSNKLTKPGRLEYWVRSDCLFEWSDRNFHGRIGIMEVCILTTYTGCFLWPEPAILLLIP